jgi:hypothetical protein
MSTTPLNDDEYDQLDDLLAAISADSMDVARLEGLLTALVVGPEELAQSAWLPLVWGSGAGTAEATALILRHHDYMRVWMQQDPASFEPIYECGGNWTVEAWCAGFLAGVQLGVEAWAPLRAQQPACCCRCSRRCRLAKWRRRWYRSTPSSTRRWRKRPRSAATTLPVRQRPEIQKMLRLITCR